MVNSSDNSQFLQFTNNALYSSFGAIDLLLDSKIRNVSDKTNDWLQISSDLFTSNFVNNSFCTNHFKLTYSSDRMFVYNPSGTSGEDGASLTGAYLAYHDNGTELHLNTPNATYAGTTSQSTNIKFNGVTKIQFSGAEQSAIRFYGDSLTAYNEYGVIGCHNTFPSILGNFGGEPCPFSENYFYWGGSDIDANDEGCLVGFNSRSCMIGNNGDASPLVWYDEDTYSGTRTGWYINTAGVAGTFSDIRAKTDIKTYKNSNFEKYKKIRTTTFKLKKPADLNCKRAKTQSCINKYNNIHYGVIAQEFYQLYPELQTCEDIRDLEQYNYRKTNWETEYIKKHDEWKKAKSEFEKIQGKEKSKFKQKEPTKIFSEEEPIKHIEYERLNLLTIGVVQDLIKTVEDQKKEIEILKDFMNELITAKSFSEFKKKIS